MRMGAKISLFSNQFLSINHELIFSSLKGNNYQVINNLVINAQQAMSEGGLIKIKAENRLIR